jgi:dihydroneopterin aldolase
MDAIYLNGLEFYAYHGALEEENQLGQRFSADLVLYLSTKEAGETDDLSKTVNYAEVYEVVKSILDGPPVQLVETLCERIAAALLAQFALVKQVRVRVNKPNPPIPGILAGVAVEIVRGR